MVQLAFDSKPPEASYLCHGPRPFDEDGNISRHWLENIRMQVFGAVEHDIK